MLSNAIHKWGIPVRVTNAPGSLAHALAPVTFKHTAQALGKMGGLGAQLA